MTDPESDLVIVYLTNSINTPLLDPEEDVNAFKGREYTASTMGVICQLILQSLDMEDNDGGEALNSLLVNMCKEALQLIDIRKETSIAGDPIVQSAYGMIETVVDKALRDKELKSMSAELVNLLVPERDQAEIEKLKDILGI